MCNLPFHRFQSANLYKWLSFHSLLSILGSQIKKEKKIQVSSFYKFKMGYKPVETVHNINQTIDGCRA